MKQLRKLIVFCIATAFLYSCNNTGQNSTNESGVILGDTTFVIPDLNNFCMNSNGLANFLVHPDSAVKMVTNFEKLYGRDSKDSNVYAFIRSYKLDACMIMAIDSFFRNSTKINYDGIRVNFGASTITEASRYPNQEYQNTTSVYLFPTIKKDSTHHEDATEIIMIDTNKCKCPYIKSFSSISNSLSVFNKIYQKKMSPTNSKTKLLTNSVWIDSCVIHFMAEILRLNPKSLNGVNILTAAYLGTETVKAKGQTVSMQSTIIFEPSGSSLSKDIRIKRKFYDLIKEKVKGFIDLNHGELCPSKCG
jgi:hypothetical protein